jgi:hypothetical protein
MTVVGCQHFNTLLRVKRQSLGRNLWQISPVGMGQSLFYFNVRIPGSMMCIPEAERSQHNAEHSSHIEVKNS